MRWLTRLLFALVGCEFVTFGCTCGLGFVGWFWWLLTFCVEDAGVACWSSLLGVLVLPVQCLHSQVFGLPSPEALFEVTLQEG